MNIEKWGAKNKLQTANCKLFGVFYLFQAWGDAYGKQGYFIRFVRNNFQFSLRFLAEKFCSMKSFPYLCSVKRMKMVISSVGMLMLNAQFAASVDYEIMFRR